MSVANLRPAHTKAEAPRVEPLAAAAEAPARKRPSRARRRGFYLLGAVGVLGLAGYGAVVALTPPHATTNDAYVSGDVVAVTSREAGNVTAIYADNTESVRRGQPLLDLDASTADANLAEAEAQLGRIVRDVRADTAHLDSTAAEIAKAQTDLSRAQADLERRQEAQGDGAVSTEDVAHALEAEHAARAALDLARGRQLEAQAAVRGAALPDNPMVLAAAAAVRRAAIVRRHLQVTAPVDGVVGQRTVQLGQQVTPGAPLMAIVPLQHVWVDANFRETQLADIRVGQPVRIVSDAYGRKTVFHGRVHGLAAGSGSAFALLPAQNATGNWIKVTQRLPVRIDLDPSELARDPLRIGLSVTATVDTRSHVGPAVARASQGVIFSEPSEDAGPEVEARIVRIIAQNRG
jgi:membrane fusion protein (multidrug efflux system)